MQLFSSGNLRGLASLAILAALVGCGSDDGAGSDPGGGTGGVAGAAGGGGSGGGSAGVAGTGGGSAGVAGTGGGTAGMGGGTAGEAGAAGAAGNAGGSAGSAGSSVETRATLSGDITWDVHFDAAAQAAGATDCQYTRHYEGVEDESKPWVCANCEVIFRAAVQMTAGQSDCYTQISDQEPVDEEWVGYANGTWFRTPYDILAASDQGTAVVDSGTVTTHNEVADLDADIVGAGKFGFDIDGSLVLGEEDGDPNHGWLASDPYACGWEKANPPAYTGDYTVELGKMLPDGLFRDKCDEVYRLHDAKGKYLVLIMSALDCPACKSMAAGEANFVADLASSGIAAETITLMQPSLNDPFGDTSKAQLDYWSTKYDIASPVVADRGLGLFMFLPIYPDELGYPAWLVVDPDLKVLRYGSGLDWASIRATIVVDAQ